MAGSSRDRTGSYLISLCVGAAIFGMFTREDLSGVDPLAAPAD